ncbi:peptidylprolyl isomerase [Rhodoblastus acidophilus]|uniref:Peptidyl-prolyl cis-trans isomerase n=1 Tax=Rhodoblastus acidophilus TaxID=1074 RepID=A0A6N8DHK6_RHOAC|nr:peptidylprolyl isomerase [Rhodoblastus acidophilus]MCW2272882.1 peptidylprolyl isomerase [Rhodoblastus acidophilus]MTV29789.1 peptidylprolyl isomerase [Rhodoblastus acidophilus]
MTDFSNKLDRRRFSGIALGFAGALAGAGAARAADDPENLLYLQLKDGRVVIRLRPDLAPKHVAQIKALARKGFYDGIVFHRVIDGFMAQTGDPTGTGTGGSDLPNIPAEFSQEPFKRGTLGMARSSSPNSANSQFFICFAAAPFLNGQYTVWGEVISGMEFVDKIKRGEPPANPDKIVSMKVAADVK